VLGRLCHLSHSPAHAGEFSIKNKVDVIKIKVMPAEERKRKKPALCQVCAGPLWQAPGYFVINDLMRWVLTSSLLFRRENQGTNGKELKQETRAQRAIVTFLSLNSS
jgi:hypothetical protein